MAFFDRLRPVSHWDTGLCFGYLCLRISVQASARTPAEAAAPAAISSDSGLPALVFEAAVSLLMEDDQFDRIYDQVFGNGTSVPATGGAGGSVSAPSGQVQSGMSASYYQETYDRWARVAESAYRSLTATGISVHNRKTDEHAGSAAGTWQGSNYAGMKSELRQAQNAMRDVRNEAQRNGITIRQSTWETATVSY